MVDSTSSSKRIFVGHPTTVRGHRTSFAVSGGFAYFGVRDNLVAKGLNPATTNEVSTIYTTSREKISAVSVSNDGQKIAFGDDKGKVTILKWENGQLEQHKEHYMLTGIVNEIVWSKDNKVLVAVGEKACALNPESGSRTGDVLGATGKILCAVFTPENVLFSAGEGNEILRHDGVPFKGQGKPIKHPHTGFVNQMRLSPDKTKFATASADKSICIFDAKSGELIKHYAAAHSMGIYDLVWIDDQTLATASADNSVK
jgi:WD40 repeat protein